VGPPCKGIEHLSLNCKSGSRVFRLFQTFADAVNNAQSLRKLRIRAGQNFPEDSSGLTALANAFREHTALQDLTWFDCFDTVQGASRDLSLDPVLRALPACLHLRNVSISTKCASVGAMKNLLQLQSAAILTLGLTTEHWLAVADRIRQGRCNVQNLNLVLLQSSNFNDTEVVEAVASAIREDSTIESLGLLTNYDFTDEAGVALAEALTVNQTLRMLNVSTPRSRQGRNAVALSAPTCASIPVSF
jgi:hypothetical protein